MADRRIGRQVSRYQRLLIAYPRSHRQAYGPAMVQLFSDRLHEDHPRRNRLGLLTFWFGMLIDLGKSALAERTEAMMKGLRKENWWLITVSLIAALYVVISVGIGFDQSGGAELLFGDLLLALVVTAAAGALIMGMWLRSTRPQLGNGLLIAGLIPAALSGAVLFWFPPFWVLTVLGMWLISKAVRELGAARRGAVA